MAAILNNGCHFEFGSHFKFENVKFALLDLKFITSSDAESFTLNRQRRCGNGDKCFGTAEIISFNLIYDRKCGTEVSTPLQIRGACCSTKNRLVQPYRAITCTANDNENYYIIVLQRLNLEKSAT